MSELLKHNQLVRVAELYYEQNLSQQKIAKILNCSHSTVSRLLSEARETGVVEIKIDRPIRNVPTLAKQIRDFFNLKDAIVVPNGGNEEQTVSDVSKAAAHFLLSIVTDHMKIGVTWGNTLYHMLETLGNVNLKGIEVIQLSGSLGQGNPEIDGPNIAIQLAKHFNGVCRLVAAPAIVTESKIRDALIQQPQIKHVLDLGAKANIMIQGIGALETKVSSLERAGYITREDLEEVEKAGAVGHINARMIDVHGREVSHYSSRTISIPLDAMREAMWSIGISASISKAPAILGALRGKYFNTVVIEEASAREVLHLARAAAA